MISILQVVSHAAGNKSLVVVADNTDVFALLLHVRHAGAINAATVYMESPLKGRSVIDICYTGIQGLNYPELPSRGILGNKETILFDCTCELCGYE